MSFQAPRGTEDVLPKDAHRWTKLENDFRALTALFGYSELRTPTFEEIELFTRTSGETSDVVSKEMYEFTDKGGRLMALKPEGTAPAVRAVIEHGLCPQGSLARLSYVTPIFRYGRPQKGRLREAHQVGIELIGSDSALADAEVIEVTAAFYKTIGIEPFTVRINTIGRDECRTAFKEVILDRFSGYIVDQDEESRAKIAKNPLRLLDSKDPVAAEVASAMPPILDYLEPDSKARFERLQDLLLEANVPFEVAPDIVRGLDYYTETVFEVQSSHLGAQSSLCGGGRYNNLVKDLGGASTPSVGVAMGIERALLVLDAIATSSEPSSPVAYLVTASPDAAATVRSVARELRSAGLSAVFDLEERKMAGQLKQADKANAKVALILGEDELKKGVVVLRRLGTGVQEEVALEKVVEAVRLCL